MKFKEVNTVRLPNGGYSCTIHNEVGSITFVRNSAGKIRWSARTTGFPPGEFTAAVKLAANEIQSREREDRAAAPLPGCQPRLA